MSSEWPPDEPGRRQPPASSGGSHRRSAAVQTPPFGTDVRGMRDTADSPFFADEPSGYGNPGYGEAPRGPQPGAPSRSARHRSPGAQDSGGYPAAPPAAPGRGRRGYDASAGSDTTFFSAPVMDPPVASSFSFTDTPGFGESYPDATAGFGAPVLDPAAGDASSFSTDPGFSLPYPDATAGFGATAAPEAPRRAEPQRGSRPGHSRRDDSRSGSSRRDGARSGSSRRDGFRRREKELDLGDLDFDDVGASWVDALRQDSPRPSASRLDDAGFGDRPAGRRRGGAAADDAPADGRSRRGGSRRRDTGPDDDTNPGTGPRAFRGDSSPAGPPRPDGSSRRGGALDDIRYDIWPADGPDTGGTGPTAFRSSDWSPAGPRHRDAGPADSPPSGRGASTSRGDDPAGRTSRFGGPRRRDAHADVEPDGARPGRSSHVDGSRNRDAGRADGLRSSRDDAASFRDDRPASGSRRRGDTASFRDEHPAAGSRRRATGPDAGPRTGGTGPRAFHQPDSDQPYAAATAAFGAPAPLSDETTSHPFGLDGDQPYAAATAAFGAPAVSDETASHPFGLHVPRQGGPVSAPFATPSPRTALDEVGTLGLRPPADLPESGPPPGFAASSAGTATRRRAPEAPAGPRTSRRTQPPQTRSGRRRGGHPSPAEFLSTGHARWIALGGVAAVIVVIVAAMSFLGGGPSGPAHTLVTPAKLGNFTRSSALARQMDVSQLEKSFTTESAGQVTHIVSAVYQDGTPVVGGPTPPEILFIGGQLSGTSATDSVNSFTGHFKGATLASPGSLGGSAACAPTQTATGGAAVCAWFDNDTFGELVSPNMTASALASEMRTIRPDIELLAK